MTPAAPAAGSAPDAEGDVQLWKASLDLPGPEAMHTSVLSEEELRRASRLRFDGDRRRFVASRVWLRRLLADRLDVAASEIRLQEAPGGKPELAPPMEAWLRFSMSRSGSVGLYALARSREVGVDLEERSRVVDTEAVGSRFLSPAERGVLDKLEGEEKQLGFYRIWTRKEAVLKALGIGLDAPLAALDVSGETARWDTGVPGAPSDARCWSLQDLDVTFGHAGALACEAPIPRALWRVRDVAELPRYCW